MSQATDLLNSLTDDQILAYSADTGEEPHIVIGPDRHVTVPNSLKRIAVQYDHDVETVMFDCPRYWDNLDMSKMAVYINYGLSDGYLDSYPAKNVRADGDLMHFEWTISRNVTQVVGKITFLVCVKNTDGEGNEVNHWNSELCNDMYVSEGLETEEQIAMENTDLVTQLLLRMSSVEQINVTSEIMDEYVEEITTARDDAAVTLEGINNSAAEIRNSYANAIKGQASGEIIRVDDVSPLEHDVNVKVRGKNLVNVDFIDGESSTDRSIIQKDGNTVIFPALDGNVYGLYMDNSDLGLKVGKTYTASIRNITAFDSSSYGWRLRYTDGTTTALPHANTATFTVEKEVEKVIFRIGSPYQGNTESRVEGIQIEEGSIATEYEPYLDPSTITVTGCGKNMFDSEIFLSVTGWTYANGLYYGLPAYLHNAFGPNGGTPILTGFKPSTQYIVSFEGYADVTTERPVGGTFRFEYTDGSHDNISINTATRSKYTLISRVDKTVTALRMSYGHNVITYLTNVQVEEGNLATSFEVYKGSTATPTTDGICTVKSVSPTMTLFTDTPGAIVEAEYNRDTTKMFESYVLTDNAKNEIAGLVKNDVSAEINAIEATLDEIIALQESLI